MRAREADSWISCPLGRPLVVPLAITVLEHAMELNPTRRYQTPTEMLLELRQAL